VALIANDDLIAGILNRNGLVTGNGNVTRERVTSLDLITTCGVQTADDGIEPWLNLSKAAQLLKIAPKTLRLAAEAGEISAVHPLPDAPGSSAARSLIVSSTRHRRRARQNPNTPRDRIPISKTYSLQPHRQWCSDAGLCSAGARLDHDLASARERNIEAETLVANLPLKLSVAPSPWLAGSIRASRCPARRST